MSGEPSQHRQAYAYCAYCPKVCRFACPVSEATHNETTSTWGKMTQAFLATEKERPLSSGSAQALYACTGCMRCRSVCKHDNEVGLALFSARSLAVSQEKAPAGASSTLETFRKWGNPFGPELSERALAHTAKGPVRYPLFPGCSSLMKNAGGVEDAVAASAELGAPVAVARLAGRCCGYPLYAAGDLEAFTAHARQTAEAMEGYAELAVLDPGCAYTFKVVYPRVGVTLKTRVETVYELLAARLQHAPARPPLEVTAAYHDACHLGRGLGQYDQPRALLRAAVSEVREATERREEGGCSGGGGLLPRTMVETAVDIARRQAERLGPEETVIVTACPTSRRMFERAGRRAEDLLSIVRRWLSV